MCEHLKELDIELKAKGIKETFRGQAWSDNAREWVYYDCILNLEKLKQRFNFPDFVTIHVIMMSNQEWKLDSIVKNVKTG